MKWYLCKLVFSIGPRSASNAQFDEQLRLIRAANETDAYFKGKQIGREIQGDIVTVKKEVIKREFLDVSEIVEIKELKDGVEVYSTTHETRDAQNFINSVLQKGIAIQSKNLVFC